MNTWSIREIGVIMRKSYTPGGCVVRWEDGSTERLNDEQSGPLLQFDKGQRFEAMVEREDWRPADNRMRVVKILSASPLEPLPTERNQALWNDIWKNAPKPKTVSWDEIK